MNKYNIKQILFKFIFVLFIIVLYILVQISYAKTISLNLKSHKIKDKIKITQISDFHSNNFLNIKTFKSNIASFKPDLIVLTGDIIDRNDEDFTHAIKLIKELQTITKSIYFVSGNHEIENRNYNGIINLFEDLGLVVLDEKSLPLNIAGNQIKLHGLSFHISEINYLNLINNMAEDDYNIILSHRPDQIANISQEKEDLILSGHTHGGQIRLPFIGGLVAPNQGFFPAFDKGTYYIGKTILYIDSGLGNSLLPLRFLNRVQFSNITIEGS